MANVFRTAYADALASMQASGSENVQDAVFTPASGDPVECLIYIGADDEFQPGVTQAQAFIQTLYIDYQRDQIAREAVRGETFTVGTTVYTVQRVLKKNQVKIRVAVK